jgi:hypothetical protein
MEILDYKPVGKGSLVAEICIKIPKWELIINKLSVFQKGSARWINFPALSFQVEGETKYYPLLKFADNELYKRFSESVLKAVDTYKAERGIE